MGRIGKQELGRIWETGADETKEMERIRELRRILRRKKRPLGQDFGIGEGSPHQKNEMGRILELGRIREQQDFFPRTNSRPHPPLSFRPRVFVFCVFFCCVPKS